MYYSPELLETFKDPVAYLKYRKDAEDGFWRNFGAQLADSDASRNSAQAFTDLMKKRLGEKPELLAQLVPDFPPHCRRLTPGPGYLEALSRRKLAPCLPMCLNRKLITKFRGSHRRSYPDPNRTLHGDWNSDHRRRASSSGRSDLFDRSQHSLRASVPNNFWRS